MNTKSHDTGMIHKIWTFQVSSCYRLLVYLFFMSCFMRNLSINLFIQSCLMVLFVHMCLYFTVQVLMPAIVCDLWFVRSFVLYVFMCFPVCMYVLLHVMVFVTHMCVCARSVVDKTHGQITRGREGLGLNDKGFIVTAVSLRVPRYILIVWPPLRCPWPITML